MKNGRKQIYGQGFAIYGLAEYYRASGDPESLQRAIQLFELIEKHSFDATHGGYLEARDRDWQPLADLRLSAKDANEPKSMNTHLHIIEPYTNLIAYGPMPVWHSKSKASCAYSSTTLPTPKAATSTCFLTTIGAYAPAWYLTGTTLKAPGC